MIIFRIRSKTTGQFSTGGSWPSFSKKGKVWTGAGPLANHLNQLSANGWQRYINEQCEVIAYELTETECYTTPIQEHLDKVGERKAAREAASKARHEAWLLERKRKEYEALKKEFEGQNG